MFRKVIFRLHLSLAVAAGLFIVTMAATGAVIACEDAVMSLAERSRSVTVPEGARRRPPDDLVAAAEMWGAGGEAPFTATSIEYRRRSDASVQVRAGRDRRVFVDPWTGEVVGGGFPFLEGFFAGVRGWHRWLGASGRGVRTGRAVTGAANVVFLFLLLTGPLLWLPRSPTRGALAERLLLRRARGTARHLNLHYVTGIWSVLPLMAISATGIVLSYPAVGDRVYGIAGAAMRVGDGGGEGATPGGGAGPVAPVASGTPGTPDVTGALEAASAQVPAWRSITLEIPRPDHARIRVRARTGRVGQPQKTSALVVDRSGGVLSVRSFRDGTPDHRVREFLRYAHSGEYWGLAGQALAGILALATVVMAWTGFSVVAVMLRLRRSKRRLASRQPPAAKQ